MNAVSKICWCLDAGIWCFVGGGFVLLARLGDRGDENFEGSCVAIVYCCSSSGGGRSADEGGREVFLVVSMRIKY